MVSHFVINFYTVMILLCVQYLCLSHKLQDDHFYPSNSMIMIYSKFNLVQNIDCSSYLLFAFP